MAHRHKVQARNIGGGTWYSGGNSNVASEAKERKEGGALVSFKRKDGGKVEFKAGGKVPAARKAGGRLDKRARGGALKRARGGGAGSDKSPYSSAGSHADHNGTYSQRFGTTVRARGGGLKKK